MPHKDPKAAAAYPLAYRQARRALAAERSRKWRKAHPGAGLEMARAWRKANPEKAAASQRKWRAKNREHILESRRKWDRRTRESRREKIRAQSLKDGLKAHGLSVEQYRSTLAAQGGGCAICKATEPRMKGAKRMYVDHCHKSDIVRGLLCFRCNTLLSMASDSPTTLRAAALYLERPLDRRLVRSEGRRLLESRRR